MSALELMKVHAPNHSQLLHHLQLWQDLHSAPAPAPTL